MSIIIQNIDKAPRATGRHDYVLRINSTVIAYFSHLREEGLAACLRRAALAAEDPNRQEAKDDRALFEAIIKATSGGRNDQAP